MQIKRTVLSSIVLSSFIWGVNAAQEQALTFDDSYIIPQPTQSPVPQKTPEIDTDGRFSGLYLRGEVTDSTETNYYDARIALEMEFLENGWREHDKRTKQKNLERSLQLMQLYRDEMFAYSQSQKSQINAVRNRVYLTLASEKESYLTELQGKQKARLESGAITQIEALDTELLLTKAKNDREYFEQLTQTGLTSEQYKIANQLAELTLKDRFDLVQMALDNASDLQILKLMKQRADYFPEYWDNVSLRAFIEERKNTRLFDSAETLIGVRVRLPLTHDFDSDDKADMEKAQYDKQMLNVTHRIKEKVASLRDQILFQMRALKNAESEFSYFSRQRQAVERQREVNMDGLKTTPDAFSDNLELKMLDAKQDILLTRLDILLLLTDLATLTQSEHLTSLFASRQR